MRTGHGKRRLTALCLCLLLLVSAVSAASAPPTIAPPRYTPAPPTPVPAAQRALIVGDSGDDVYLLKTRMQALGYFKADASLSSKVTEITLERVNLLLSDHDMAPVDTISIDVQNMILTRDDLAKAPLPTPAPTPVPLTAPAGTPRLPAQDAEGFLPEAGGEYIYADAQDGLWYYISQTLYVNIRRYTDVNTQNVWFEAEVRTRGNEQIRSFLAAKSQGCQTPVAIAQENSAVLAFSDDYFSFRGYGVAVRNGTIYRDKIRATSTSYPLGDTLAVFADGSMLASEYSAFRAEDLLQMGALHVLNFGPWLISGGELNPRLADGTYMHYHEPRMALGMIAPGHYVIIAVDGRYDGARGAYIEWVAARMLEIGVAEAINLDGGGTTAMVFMGQQISRVASARPDGLYTRKVTSMLGFGVTDFIQEP